MENNEILNMDRMRILGSIFWVLGATISLAVALKAYDFDLNKKS
ncbi:MAG: hypothetical protein PHO63_05320 [Bacilli bacterium]|nr:hypothetical protein [Bacilli bacterium]MDD4808502.1 hypothetical protein [Bacilli bacterium]